MNKTNFNRIRFNLAQKKRLRETVKCGDVEWSWKEKSKIINGQSYRIYTCVRVLCVLLVKI